MLLFSKAYPKEAASFHLGMVTAASTLVLDILLKLLSHLKWFVYRCCS